jgi:hypothetical protein
VRSRLALLAGVLALAAALVIPTTSAFASSAPMQGCADRTTCMYQNTGYGGTEQDYYNPAFGGGWINLPINERASVDSTGWSDVWFYNEMAGLYTCVPAQGESTDLTFPGGFGDPGWMYIDYGVNQNCQEDPPAGAPGT